MAKFRNVLHISPSKQFLNDQKLSVPCRPVLYYIWFETLQGCSRSFSYYCVSDSWLSYL